MLVLLTSIFYFVKKKTNQYFILFQLLSRKNYFAQKKKIYYLEEERKINVDLFLILAHNTAIQHNKAVVDKYIYLTFHIAYLPRSHLVVRFVLQPRGTRFETRHQEKRRRGKEEKHEVFQNTSLLLLSLIFFVPATILFNGFVLGLLSSSSVSNFIFLMG